MKIDMGEGNTYHRLCSFHRLPALQLLRTSSKTGRDKIASCEPNRPGRQSSRSPRPSSLQGRWLTWFICWKGRQRTTSADRLHHRTTDWPSMCGGEGWHQVDRRGVTIRGRRREKDLSESLPSRFSLLVTLLLVLDEIRAPNIC